MATVNFSNFGEEPVDEQKDGFEEYTGPNPPMNEVLNFELGTLQYKPNKKGDNMFSLVMNVKEPEGSPNAQYNGFSQWVNQVPDPNNKVFTKRFVNGLGVSWDDFVNKKTVIDPEDEKTVTMLGGKKINRGDKLRATLYEKNGYVNVGKWLPVQDEEDQIDDDNPPF